MKAPSRLPALLALLLGCGTVPAGELSFVFETRLNDRPLILDESMGTNAIGQVVSVSRLDWLLSEIQLHSEENGWLAASRDSFFISEGRGRNRFSMTDAPAGRFDRLSFRIGLNPETNAANPASHGPAHPLNPVLNGLHWSWQNGYVFLALEGKWTDPETSRSGGYSYHLGNDHMRMIVDLPLELTLPTDRPVKLRLDLDTVLGGPAPIAFGTDTASTHGRRGDPLADKLQTNAVAAFSVEWINRTPVEPDSKPAASIVLINPQATPYRFTFGRQFPPPRLPRDNPLTREGVALGRELFQEPLLSLTENQSCASCHQPAAGFVDPGRAFSLGAEGSAGTRNTMPLFNLAWKERFFWDGRAATLREQVLMPIQNPIEMHETLPRAVAKLESAGYSPRFNAAFDSPEINPDRVARALEQFVLTIISQDSRFDRAMRGKATLTELEKKGFLLFNTEYDPRRGLYGADCFHCHGGPLFSNNGFADNGLDQTYRDRGLGGHTGRKQDEGRFAVPSLRNVELTAPYMHDGRFRTLEEAVAHYGGGVRPSPSLDPNLAKHPVGGVPLPPAQQQALVAFLKTLTDDQFRPDTADGRF
ncbi:MAG: cytochrome C peroxidase [Verrucomicrobia bacterium]|nr:cytochrome C peroxidase [Verrucomicrobiota bacterium]